MKNRDIAWISMISALYVIITLIFAYISYGPIQVRISEALTLLPFFDKRAIFALFIGCLVSNIFGGLGMYDIIFGSVFTLIAAFLTYKMKSIYMAGMPPVIINAFGVGLYLSLLFKLPYWTTVIYIGLGELISVYGIGLPLFLYLSRRKILQRSEVV